MAEKKGGTPAFRVRFFIHDWTYRLGMKIVGLGLRLDPREYDTSFAYLADQEDDMCPNCVTPWKCNGPHVITNGVVERAVLVLPSSGEKR